MTEHFALKLNKNKSPFVVAFYALRDCASHNLIFYLWFNASTDKQTSRLCERACHELMKIICDYCHFQGTIKAFTVKSEKSLVDFYARLQCNYSPGMINNGKIDILSCVSDLT